MKTESGFIHYLKAQRLSDSTLNSSEKIFNLFIDWVAKEQLSIKDIGYTDILGYMQYCSKKGISQRTIQHYLNVVRHYYDYLIKAAILTINPVTGIVVKGVKRKTLYPILTPVELAQLYDQYPIKSLSDKRNKVMLGLLVYQGIKTQELARLNVDDVTLGKGKIKIPGSRKSNGRTLVLQSLQVLDLMAYIQQTRAALLAMKPKRSTQTKQATDLLFISAGGQSQSISNLVTQLMVKVRKINANAQNARQLRASVITQWVKQYNLREAQYLSGHRYVSTTESYQENNMEELKEEIEKYHPLGQ